MLPEEQGAEIRASPFRIGPTDDDKLLSVQAFDEIKIDPALKPTKLDISETVFQNDTQGLTF